MTEPVVVLGSEGSDRALTEALQLRGWAVDRSAPPRSLVAGKKVRRIVLDLRGSNTLASILEDESGGTLEDMSLAYIDDRLELIELRYGDAELRKFLDRPAKPFDEAVYLEGGAFRSDEATRIRTPLPRQVYLGLTQKCNRSCSFCVSRTYELSILPLDVVRKLARDLRGSTQVVALTGAGEAMMHPEFWDALDVLIEEIPGVRFKMNTSGVALTKNSTRLLDYPFENITVSLNAENDETYKTFIGPGFGAVISGIRTLVRERAARGARLTIALSNVLMISTVKELPDFVRLAFELGVEQVQGIYLMIYGDQLRHETPWLEPRLSNHFFSVARESARKFGVQLNLPPEFELAHSVETGQLSSLPVSQGQQCVEAWSTIYLRPNGDVIPCPYTERSLGNIFQSDIETIWSGEPYRELRESLLSRNYYEMCRTCCGFNESGNVDDYLSHWLDDRRPDIPLKAIYESRGRGSEGGALRAPELAPPLVAAERLTSRRP